ncbi:TAM domain methyltransferase [Eremomyces bilateralis CBS 781.70]|uniref:TAM domain methyltransferase n=1 Tax=Eremomyces bilateralis CBS 781.70 TaxID=1392243 RepID=A0A6G1FZS0_9PEZI|nr:TAM domain methyltransferase [Eremomyces bilateralis CBS 781.70]KAF1811222.1 TAM domain methyltransferase [Eremomyces bilateralis CBS 781.70]
MQLEIDTGEDNDSLFSEEGSTRSASIASSVLNYTYENGRRYHAYRKGAYLLPNDEEEQDRLDLMHHIYRLCLDGKLHLAPLKPDVQRVLDIGTGTGIWAIDFADEYTSAEVIGNDLSPTQPSWVPPNLKFYIDDIEAEWTYSPSEAFDYIHVRGMGGSILDWNKLYQQSFKNLKPGGWLELHEPEAMFRGDDGTEKAAESVQQWQGLINQAARKFGKELDRAPLHKQRLIDAGFIDVHEEIFKVPVGPWAKDPKYKLIGRYQREHAVAGIEPYTLGFIVKILGWSQEEAQIMIANVLNELKDRRLHLYVPFYYVYGRKPESKSEPA